MENWEKQTIGDFIIAVQDRTEEVLNDRIDISCCSGVISDLIENAKQEERERILEQGLHEFHKVFLKTGNNIMLQQDFEEIVNNLHQNNNEQGGK